MPQRPGRYNLFLQFSVLSFIAFLLIGYFVVSAIRPAVSSFIVSRQEADAVVFANRSANRLLTKEEFASPQTFQSRERLLTFVESLQVPARLAAAVASPEGEIVSSDIPEFVGKNISEASGFKRALGSRSFAQFRDSSEEEEGLTGASEVFELFVPVTFGASPEVAGVIYTLSRTGFVREVISGIERDLTFRIGGGLLALYLLLSVIVLGASRTIRKQALALQDYASTLEEKVDARTRELKDSTGREVAALKEVTRLKDEFLFVATHDIRAPVTSIRWSLDIIRRDKKFLNAIPESLKRPFDIMVVSLDRLHALVADLLNVARLESGTFALEKKIT